MAMDKKLGRIESVCFGKGGYQDAMFGLTVNMGGAGWGVGDFFGWWGLGIKCDEYCKWTEEDRNAEFAKTMRRINEIMRQAKVTDVARLKGIPVEVEFDGNYLKSWRVLEEVL